MTLRTGIWLTLVVVHLVAFVMGGASGYPALVPVVGATIYWPLLPLAMLGLPVLREAGLLSPPGPFGWFALVVFWLALHWLFALLMAKLLGGRNDI